MNALRQDGQPMRRLAEFYVLWSIGELAAADRAQLEAMAPKLAGLYGGDGSWHGAVAVALGFPPHLPEVIRRMWDDNRQSFGLLGRTLTPQAFARGFVDSNSAPAQG